MESIKAALQPLALEDKEDGKQAWGMWEIDWGDPNDKLGMGGRGV